MADRDAILLPPARAFHDSLPALEQIGLDEIIQDLCDTPEPDEVLRFLLDSPPEFPFLYRDDRFLIIYEEVNAWTIEVWYIGHNSDDAFMETRRPSEA